MVMRDALRANEGQLPRALQTAGQPQSFVPLLMDAPAVMQAQSGRKLVSARSVQ